MQTVQMAQCQMFNEEQGNGILTREKGAYYSGSALTAVFVIFLMYKIVRLYFYKQNNLEDQIKANGLNDDKR